MLQLRKLGGSSKHKSREDRSRLPRGREGGREEGAGGRKENDAERGKGGGEMGERERERERETERERERDRDRQTERERDRKRQRQTDRDRQTARDRQTERETERERARGGCSATHRLPVLEDPGLTGPRPDHLSLLVHVAHLLDLLILKAVVLHDRGLVRVDALRDQLLPELRLELRVLLLTEHE